MNKTTIFTILLYLPAIGAGYLLYDGIRDTIVQREQIKENDERVVEKLKVIRKAQKEYQSMYGRYTDNWDSLISFVKDSTKTLVEKHERYETRDKTDPDYLRLGEEKVIITYDTLGVVSIEDFLFPDEQYPDFDPDRLPYVPGRDTAKFDLFVDKVEQNNRVFDLIEVVNKQPFNPSRSDENADPRTHLLRFGSRTKVTTSGNWGAIGDEETE